MAIIDSSYTESNCFLPGARRQRLQGSISCRLATLGSSSGSLATVGEGHSYKTAQIDLTQSRRFSHFYKIRQFNLHICERAHFDQASAILETRKRLGERKRSDFNLRSRSSNARKAPAGCTIG